MQFAHRISDKGINVDNLKMGLGDKTKHLHWAAVADWQTDSPQKLKTELTQGNV